MPVYEYLCQDCNRRFSRFFWRISDAEGTQCRCGSRRLEQLVSRVSMPRSEESRMESMADPNSWSGMDENDPKSMARMIKKMGSEMGEDLGPEFGEGKPDPHGPPSGGRSFHLHREGNLGQARRTCRPRGLGRRHQAGDLRISRLGP